MGGHKPAHLAARIGGWSARHRKLAITLWLTFVLGSFAISTAVGTRELSDAEGGTGESGRAERMIEDAGFRDVDREVVVIQSRGPSSSSPRYQAVTAEVRRALQSTTGVAAIQKERRSDDGRTILVEFEYEGSDIEEVIGVVEGLSRSHPDYYIAQFGEESAEKEIDEEIANDFRRAEIFSIPLTLIILVAAFGALVAAAVPLLVALTAVMAALGLLSVVSQAVPVDDAAGSVILLIGLAVGVDYSLFYLRREREERVAGKGVEAALDAAAATSGRAVLISGLTVLIAMAGMLVSGSREIASVGVGAMLVVAVALVGSLTVLPALLAVLGDRVERLRIPLLRRIPGGDAGAWRSLVGRVMRRPVRWGLAAAVPLVFLSIAGIQLHLVTPDVSSLPKKLSAVQTYERIQSAFPVEKAPAAVVIRADEANSPALRTAVARLRHATDVETVDVNPARTVAVVSIPLPGTGTDATSEEALARVKSETIPRALHDIPGIEVAVTGPTASLTDFTELMKRRAPLVFGFVLGLAFLLLLVAFRSIVIAGKAIVLNLLSVGAAYGLLVVVFQHGFGESLLGFDSNGGVVPWLPMFLFVVLFGLSMDYHVFILSRVREAVGRGESTEDAVLHAISATAGTVTSAAAVMVAVFAIFATLTPLEMKQLGVGLAAAILIDATLVRAVLLPAAMKLLGNWNWYLPRWLNWMPRVSLEGAH